MNSAPRLAPLSPPYSPELQALLAKMTPPGAPEWGVHVAAFAQAAGFSPEQNAAIADPEADDAALTPRDRLLVQMVDELHDTATISDALWPQLAALWSPAQLIELLMLAGWYRAISYVCNAARVPLETWAERW